MLFVDGLLSRETFPDVAELSFHVGGLLPSVI